MLKTLAVKGFKSLIDTGPIEFAPLTVLFGPNGGGKSNVLDALSVLRQAANAEDERAVLPPALRARPLELFSFPAGGLPELLRQSHVRFEISGCFLIAPDPEAAPVDGRYSVAIAHEPRSSQIKAQSTPEDPRDYFREALTMYAWRFHSLEPRGAMRSEQPLAPVEDVGPLGERVGSYLFQVKRDRPEEWAALQRTLRVLIPSVDLLDVELDERRGTVALEIRQGGVSYSARQVSEGTLRVLGLLAAVTNPDARLVAFEEPENGVHPQRIELIARLLVSQAIEAPRPKQIVVTTHSPILCGALIRHAREHPGKIALLRVVQGRGGTKVKPLDIDQPAFKDDELRRQLATVDDIAVFEGLILRGLLDD